MASFQATVCNVSSESPYLIVVRRENRDPQHWRKARKVMKSPKLLFTNLKPVALVLVLAGLIFAVAVVATKTLLQTDTGTETSYGRNVNANYDGPGMTANAADAGVSGGGTTVNGGNPSTIVWVNTNSGVYHCPNTRWYGNTKSGTYMTQKEAQSKGYRPAYRIVCG